MIMRHWCKGQDNNPSKEPFGQQPYSNALISPGTEQLAVSHYQYSASVCSAKRLTELSDSISVTFHFKQHNWRSVVK